MILTAIYLAGLIVLTGVALFAFVLIAALVIDALTGAKPYDVRQIEKQEADHDIIKRTAANRYY